MQGIQQTYAYIHLYTEANNYIHTETTDGD